MTPDNVGTTSLVAGRYELDAVIARGGMGTVWRGVDNRLQRPVAIKEVVVDASRFEAAEAARARVLREAHAAARVSHPGVVAMYDVIDGGDRVYLVMELVDAPTLAEVVAESGPLTPAEVARLGVRLCDALAVAHAQGIVHRDLKPSNVLVLPGRRDVKLADFGIAASIHDPSITLTGVVLGSPSFMAPEQARGERATPATDLWGLGALLYFAVEGVAPFERPTTMAIVHAVVHDPPAPCPRAGPLGAVLAGLLEKDPAARLALGEVRARLVAARDDAPTGAVAVAPPDAATDATVAVPLVDDPTRTQVLPAARGPRPPRRLRWVGLVIALALLVGLGLSVAAAEGGGPRVTAPSDTAPTTVATAPPTTAPPTTAAPAPTGGGGGGGGKGHDDHKGKGGKG